MVYLLIFISLHTSNAACLLRARSQHTYSLSKHLLHGSAINSLGQSLISKRSQGVPLFHFFFQEDPKLTLMFFGGKAGRTSNTLHPVNATCKNGLNLVQFKLNFLC